MKMTGHTIRLEGQRSHSLCVPEQGRVIAREVFGDGENWSRIDAACSHLLNESTSLIGLSVVRILIYLVRVTHILYIQIKIEPF